MSLLEKRRKKAKTPMVQFRALSHKFDEENELGPMKVDRIKIIK